MIDQLREEGYKVTEICEAFEVSKSGYYAAKKRGQSKRQEENEVLLSEINEIHKHRHTKAYGSPRVTAELKSRGYECSENRVARLMASEGIQAKSQRAYRPRTTIQDPNQKASPNLVKNKEPEGPGEIFVSDITYVATRQGWLYLGVVIDLFSRSVVGWSLKETMKTSLVTQALLNALSHQAESLDAIFHSDQGSQYGSHEFRDLLASYGITQSMSAKGYCYDNAFCESFFASLKREAFPENGCFETKEEARGVIFDYLETFYNRKRRHSSLGNLSPEQFLEIHLQTQNSDLN